MYMTGRTDAAFSSVPFFLAVVESKRPSSAVRFADPRPAIPELRAIRDRKTIGAKRDALKHFTSVVAGCWTYIFNGHEDEGVRAIIAARPQAKLDPRSFASRSIRSRTTPRPTPFARSRSEPWRSRIGSRR